MTILERLAASRAPVMMELTSSGPPPIDGFDNQPSWDNWKKSPGPFDNRPSWDNWNKK
ncbi:multiple cyclophane-containing RiPP AmcA [Spongiactinospora rosea]|uniref:multiple cyclophane-containing RiPP AmcA n=1 Tax=Spongiactinospora rosea TaxID=2248750 RepID=UPI00298D6322|nr:multiple cyclophane-containing RiPP AmcA [Spongiactinospora rosea]